MDLCPGHVALTIDLCPGHVALTMDVCPGHVALIDLCPSQKFPSLFEESYLISMQNLWCYISS